MIIVNETCSVNGCKNGAAHSHHIKPVSIGGGLTIPVCESHHAKIHDLPIDAWVNHGELTRRGLEKIFLPELTAVSGILLMYIHDVGSSIIDELCREARGAWLRVYKYYLAWCNLEDVDPSILSKVRFKKRLERIVEIGMSDVFYLQFIMFNYLLDANGNESSD